MKEKLKYPKQFTLPPLEDLYRIIGYSEKFDNVSIETSNYYFWNDEKEKWLGERSRVFVLIEEKPTWYSSKYPSNHGEYKTSDGVVNWFHKDYISFLWKFAKKDTLNKNLKKIDTSEK